jgi:hypothetical protein
MHNNLLESPHTYYQYDFDTYLNNTPMNNRLYTTFTNLDDIDSLVGYITKKYEIMYNKIFVLHIKSNDEYVITYNIDQGNITEIPENTILVHRKKEFNVLYSLNGLNELIKTLNGGVLDNGFEINWSQYKNSILLTQKGEFKQLQTKLHKIINL